MATYKLVIERRAEGEFLAIPFPFRRQLNQLLFKLLDDPRSAGSELIDEGSFRVRACGRVVLYEVDDDRALITISGFRKEAPTN